MSRLPLIDPAGARDPLVTDAYRRIALVRGEVANWFRVLAHQPALVDPVFALSQQVRERSSLPARLRELATFTTALALDVPYEVAHHIEGGPSRRSRRGRDRGFGAG